MAELEEPTLIEYRPEKQIVHRRQVALLRAFRLFRQSEVARQGAIWGFAVSVAASVILVLLLIGGVDFAGYGMSAVLFLPFAGIAIGSVIAVAFQREAFRVLAFGFMLSLAVMAGLLLLIVGARAVKSHDYVTCVIVIAVLWAYFLGVAFLATMRRR